MEYSLESRRVLVTGASGFIGSKLCRSLRDQGHEVFGTYNSPSRRCLLEEMGVKPIQLELAEFSNTAEADDSVNTPALPQVDVVFHLAGMLSGPLNNLIQVNGEATRALASHYAQQNVPPRFLYVSSVAAGGPSSSDAPRRENDKPMPSSNYGRSKFAGEVSVAAFADRMRVTIVRPGIVFGEGDREFVQLINSLHKLRSCPVVGSGTQPLAFVEVNDLVNLLMVAAERGETIPAEMAADPSFGEGRGIYYGVDSTPLSLVQVKDLYREATHRFAFSVHLPTTFGWMMGAAAELGTKTLGLKTTLSRDKIREAMAPGWWASSQKANDQLNWRPKYPVDETMRRWIRQMCGSVPDIARV